MDAPTPPPLTLDDLDRDELLYLARQAYVLQRPRDLWRARWEIAILRAEAAGRELVAASQAVVAAFPKTTGSAAALRRQWKAHDSAEAAYQRARRKSDRADRIEQAAYRALEACR